MSYLVLWLWSSAAVSAQVSYNDISKHRNFGYLPTDVCGENQDDRIIGGTKASLGQFPWMARLGYRIRNCKDSPVFRCGGALITKFHVITAGHCISNLPEDLCSDTNEFERAQLATVRLGEHFIDTDPDCEGAKCADPVQDIDIADVIPYPEYNNPKLRHDIGLIKLKTPAIFSRWVTPICLIYGEFYYQKYLDMTAIIAGWGLVDVTTEALSKVLEYIKVPMVPIQNCIDMYRSRVNISITQQICAGGLKGQDSCRGDSGGPLVIVDDSDLGPKYKLLGIVSFGFKKCGDKPSPAIYTNILYYENWILDNF